MKEVYLIGTGQTPVSKGLNKSNRALAAEAVTRAIHDAGLEKNRVTALVAGNMMSGILSKQQQLGPLCADAAGLRGVEAATVESACASGAAATRWGFMCVAGGFHNAVAVCGVEQMTHASKEDTTTALATASDWETEGGHGESFISLNAKLMSLYMKEYGYQSEDFAHFAVNAHKNAASNPNAMLRKPIDKRRYLSSKPLVGPVKLFDAPPMCDGAAAIILASREVALEAERNGLPMVRVRASAIGTDCLSLDDRIDKLSLTGARRSCHSAYEQAGVTAADIDLFELHDAYTVITALSLEAAGFAKDGEGARFGQDGEIALNGRLPISTFGGLKARGHPVGATGVYQMAETYQQLTETAGENQVPNAEVALVQNIGGTGASVVSHILTKEAA